MTAPKPKEDPRGVSPRALMWWCGSLLAAVSVLGTLHARYVIPSILREAREVIESEIEQHRSESIHHGAVPRAELEARLEAQSKQTEIILDQINARLARIEARLDEK